MKKILVLSLVLVFALSSAAMANISFSGSFESKLATDSFSPEEVNWEFTNVLTLSVKATGEGVGWTFEGGLTGPSGEGAFELGKYKLTLEDDFFTAWVWGNGAETSTKASNLGFVSAPAAAASAARVEVPVMDVTTLTVDYRGSEGEHGALRMFADLEVNDIEIGLAGGRYYEADEAPANTLVASAGTAIDIFTIDGAVGVTLGEALGYAAGLDAGADVTEEISVGAKAWFSNPGFEGDVASDKVHVSGNVDYNDGTIWAKAALTFEGAFEEFGFTSDTQRVDFGYRFDDSVAFGDILGKYNELTAPATRGFVERKGVEEGAATLSAQVGAASPLMDDFLWGKITLAFVGNADGQDYTLATEDDAFITRRIYALADAYVAVSDRLVVKPHLRFRNVSGDVETAPLDISNGEIEWPALAKGNALLTSVGAEYKVGGVDGPTLNLSVSNEAFFGVQDAWGADEELDMVQKASISIKVTF